MQWCSGKKEAVCIEEKAVWNLAVAIINSFKKFLEV